MICKDNECETCFLYNQISLYYQPVAVLPKEKVDEILDSKIGSVNKIVLPYKCSQCNSVRANPIDIFLNSKLNCQLSFNSLPQSISSTEPSSLKTNSKILCENGQTIIQEENNFQSINPGELVTINYVIDDENHFGNSDVKLRDIIKNSLANDGSVCIRVPYYWINKYVDPVQALFHLNKFIIYLFYNDTQLRMENGDLIDRNLVFNNIIYDLNLSTTTTTSTTAEGITEATTEHYLQHLKNMKLLKLIISLNIF
ncbi:hypothetical protein ACTFIY_011059 [Dictyostelium cf. discoideum]